MLLPPALKYDQHRMHHDLKIQQQAHVLYIEDIELETVDHLIHVLGVAILYLSPAGDARADLVKMLVVRGLFHDLFNVEAALGAGTSTTSPRPNGRSSKNAAAIPAGCASASPPAR